MICSQIRGQMWPTATGDSIPTIKTKVHKFNETVFEIRSLPALWRRRTQRATPLSSLAWPSIFPTQHLPTYPLP